MSRYEGWFDLIGEGLERSERRQKPPSNNQKPGKTPRDDRDIESSWLPEGALNGNS